MGKSNPDRGFNSGVEDYSEVLRSHMTQAHIPSYRALSRASGVPRSTIDALRRGQVGRLRLDTLQRIGHTLNLPLTTLVASFGPQEHSTDRPGTGSDPTTQLEALRQECDRLQTQLDTQAVTVRQQVQQEAIAQLESWLVQWPTAAHAAQQRADLPAAKLLPLVRPVETLVASWGVTAIETVGAEVPFDPQIHRPRAGAPTPGQPVRVTHVGYRQGDRLLYRAQVAPLLP